MKDGQGWRQPADLPWQVRSGAAALAVGLHALLVLMLVLHLREQDQGAPAVQAELWSPQALQHADQPHVAPPPPPPPPPSPQPQQQEVAQPKPDIALAEARRLQQAKLEQELQQQKQEQLQKQKQLQKEQQLRQQQLLQKEQQQKQQLQKEMEHQQQLAQQQEAAAEQQKRQQALKALLAKQTEAGIRAESATALTGASKRLQAVRSGANDRLRNEYIDRIRSKIRGMLILPPDLQGNPQVIYHVSVLPTGDVLSVRLVHASGQPAYDDAVQRAIYKASPLPMPPDSGLADQFRELDLHFSPSDQN